MPIVSVSLTEKNKTLLDNIQETLGLSSRSEAIRVCLRSAETEAREREELTGIVEGVLIVVHRSHNSPQLDMAQHIHRDLIKTQVHSHLKNDRCLEIFIIQGTGNKVKKMLTLIQGNDGLDYVKFMKS